MTQCQGGLQSLNFSEQVMELYQAVDQEEDHLFSSQYWNYCT
jgi:hypothetical protein